LAIGGRLIIPWAKRGSNPARVLRRSAPAFDEDQLGAVTFVPRSANRVGRGWNAGGDKPS